MNDEQQLQLQAFLDGELPEKEARDVAALIARDAEAAALIAELRHTRQALGGFESGIKLPESREFFWSKVEREILRLEPARPADETVAAVAWWRRVVVPVASVASLAAVLVAVGLISGVWRSSDDAETETTTGIVVISWDFWSAGAEIGFVSQWTTGADRSVLSG